MMEIVGNPETLLLANGNIKKMKKKNSDTTPNNKMFLNPPVVQSQPSAMEEERMREKQFCDMIMHVIDKIEKESEDDVNNEELMSETSLWDLKSFLKSSVNVSGVSENSPIVILECVTSKLANLFHDHNLYHIGSLAACSKVEADFIAARAATKSINNSNSVAPCDVLLAVEDARSVVKILSAVYNKGQGREDGKKESKNSWNLSQMTNLLQMKSPSKKFEKVMGQLSPKSIKTSIVDVFVGQSSRDDEDINSFQTI